MFFSAEPLQSCFNELDTTEIAKKVQDAINKQILNYARNTFYTNKPEYLFLKSEIIAKAGLFIAKKRYALNVINEEGILIERLDVKGIDVVRSNFPAGFRKFMEQILIDILNFSPEFDVKAKLREFKKNLPNMDIRDIALPTGVKNIKKYTGSDGKPTKGTPAHVRSSINYNNYLISNKLQKKYPCIKSSDKIKWVYLFNNPLGIDKIAFPNDDLPDTFTEFVSEYVDHNKIYENVLLSKLTLFFDALKWNPSEKEDLSIFF